jgi:hypothetical protein
MWRIQWAPNNGWKWQMEFNSAFKGLITLAFWIHGHNAQAALACTAGDGCFSCDQMRRTPSNMSMISIASISLAHSPSTRHTFSNMGPLFPLRSVMSFGIPPFVLISLWLCANLAHSAKPPTAFVSTCKQYQIWKHSSIKWQTDATFDSIYFLSNYSLNMFRVTSTHHQEFSLLNIQPPVICVAACPWHCLVVNNNNWCNFW